MLIVNDFECACEAAIEGVGVAQVPSIVCRQAVEEGRLVALAVEGRAPRSVPVHALYPSRQHLPLKVRRFVDLLAAMVAPMQPLMRP